MFKSCIYYFCFQNYCLTGPIMKKFVSNKKQVSVSIKVSQSIEKVLVIHYVSLFYSDHVGEMTKCDGHFINPRCVCAYEMYTERIFDICNKIAPRKNGSLYHTSGKTRAPLITDIFFRTHFLMSFNVGLLHDFSLFESQT